MADTHSKSSVVYFNGYDLTGYATAANHTAEQRTAEVTAFGDANEEHIQGQTASMQQIDCWFDQAASASDAIINGAFGNDDRLLMYFPGGDSAIGDKGYGYSGICQEAPIRTDINSAVAMSFQIVSDVGNERLTSLHPLGAETATGDETSHDGGAATTNGAGCYLVVIGFTGITSIDVIIEASSTNAFAGEETTLATFTQVTAINAMQRIAVSGTVPRYLRASWTIVGTGSATFCVAIARR